ncbi:MAG: alkaline phosphatase family protein [Actinomycetota bacterium]
MTLADSPLARLESLLTDSSMTAHVDSVVVRTGDGFRAASARGTVDFSEADDGSVEILAESGDHPLRNQALDEGIGTDAEVALEGAPLGELATPLAYESIVQYFDAEHAPDAAVMWSPQQMFHDCIGNHGSLGALQARAPFIAAGPGIRARGVVPEHVRTVDVAPTIAALLDIPAADGVDGRGRPRGSARLAVQDGDEIAGLLDPDERPEHVVVFLWDGVNPNALHDAADRGDAPNVASLIERGTSYRHGCISALPTATLANHTTQCTGVFPGRSGILHNTWFDRTRRAHVDLLDYPQMIRARDHLAPGVETIHEALKRHEPDAFTATTYEYGDRGADYSTYVQMASNGPIPTLTDADRRLHRTDDFMGVREFRNASIYDAHSRNEALHIWRGEFGALPRFSWFTFNLTDACGHAGGPHSDILHAAIRDTDARMGDVLAEIDLAGKLDRTAIIVLADHGMHRFEVAEPFDLADAIRKAGVDAVLNDDQYVYLR